MTVEQRAPSNMRNSDDLNNCCLTHLHVERNNATSIETLTSRVNSLKDKLHALEMELAMLKQRQEMSDVDIKDINSTINKLADVVQTNSKEVAKMMVGLGIIMSACTAGLIKLLQGV